MTAKIVKFPERNIKTLCETVKRVLTAKAVTMTDEHYLFVATALLKNEPFMLSLANADKTTYTEKDIKQWIAEETT